jgi:hypothetical protein
MVNLFTTEIVCVSGEVVASLRVSKFENSFGEASLIRRVGGIL